MSVSEARDHYADEARIAELERRCARVISVLSPYHDPDDPEDTSAGAQAIRAARGDTRPGLADRTPPFNQPDESGPAQRAYERYVFGDDRTGFGG